MRNDFCEDYLMHKDRANHKYVAKIKLPSGKFYYFYNLTQYQNYMKGRGGKNTPLNVKKDPNRKEPSASDAVKKQMANDKAVQDLVAKKTPGNNVSEKVQYLRDVINKGKNKVSSILNGETTKTSSEDTSTSKKSGKSSGSGSSKSSSKKSKGASSGSKGSSSAKGSASKEKTGASKAAKASNSQSVKVQKQPVNNTPINMDTLKKVYGKEDKDISSFEGSANDFKNNMLSKYKEGSFGYLTAGNTTYKWEISGGKIILKDYDTDKEVPFDSYLKDAKSFKEFKSNTKKK